MAGPSAVGGCEMAGCRTRGASPWGWGVVVAKFPDEMLVGILKMLGPRDRGMAMLFCRRWREAGEQWGVGQPQTPGHPAGQHPEPLYRELSKSE